MDVLIFPNDKDGNMLRGMHDKGDDLSIPRDIEFSVVFPDSNSVQEFGSYFYHLDFDVRAKKIGKVSSLPWSVIITLNIAPTYEGITAFQQKLEKVAAPLGGRNYGWSCFSEEPST
ncbi:MAG: ribonuclease E inhibitor RraB [Pseudomonadota bacterium]